MKRVIFLLSFLFLLTGTVGLHAQESDSFEEVQEVPNEMQNPLKVIFGHEATVRQVVLATGEMMFDNLFVMGWNVIIKDRDWAKVNLKTMKANLSKPWVWDNNTFFMNQIGHPYHGSLYFTSARSNDLNWLESLGIAATGSLMWELFMETGAPSMNDFITTTFAGAVVGEVLHRLSFEAYDVLPLFSWILSPVNAITQLVTGDRARRPIGTLWRHDWFIGGGIAKSDFTFSDGTKEEPALHAPFFGFGFDAIYGNPYGHNSQELFDQFRVRGDILTSYNYRFFRLFMDGSLYSVSLFDWLDTDTSLAVTLNYDIFNVDDISLSASSAGLAFRQEVPSGTGFFRWDIEADYVFMGVPDVYFILNGDKKVTAAKSAPPYTYRHGPEARLGLEFEQRAFGKLSLEAQALYLMAYENTLKETKFNAPNLIAFAEAKYEHVIWGNFWLGVSDLFYFKTDWSTNILSVTQCTNLVKLYAKISFR